MWPGLTPPSASQGSRGELLLSLCYNPSANSIIVNIIKARNLKAMDIGGTSGSGASGGRGQMGWGGSGGTGVTLGGDSKAHTVPITPESHASLSPRG